MSKVKAWIKAARLRTLPLAFSSIVLGTFLAYGAGSFSGAVFGLTMITTLFLQILSNLANDYGDYASGVDGEDRVGPERTIQAGLLSPGEMKTGLIVMGSLCFVSGLSLIWLALGDSLFLFLLFLFIGLAAIAAAIKYTVGDKPYGYAGFGDLFVLIFFGLIGVGGTYFLQTLTFDPYLLLPSLSCGLLAVGVLNINNVRDIESDEKSGKLSIPVRLGRNLAVWYHAGILLLALVSSLVYALIFFASIYSWIFIIVSPFLVLNFKAVKSRTGKHLDPFLKQLALTTLLYAILFGLGSTF